MFGKFLEASASWWLSLTKYLHQIENHLENAALKKLVGDFNPFEKILVKIDHFPKFRDESLTKKIETAT